MNKLIGLIVLLVLAAPALGCDEACQRERATAQSNVEFASYLSWKFCEDTKLSFMQSDVPSLKNFRNTRLDTQYKGRIRNIKTFVDQRKAWLMECDGYMTQTNHGRIFGDEATTTKLFAAMDAMSTELGKAIKGVTYVASGDQDENAIIASKFDSFFKLMDDHRAVMSLKGQFVTN
ncbi:hypothetical protein ACXYTJ_04310 [Gilvimarinus sp. F26214L]|uniref:hypothetical protein n=1 Tax=Gilvimarinus sp. DZF01 TaxID=3461371 RepID=UPI00404643DC